MVNRCLQRVYPFFFLFFAACGGSNKFDVDTSEVAVKVDFIDWIPALDSKDAKKCYSQMRSTSKELYKYYLGRMVMANPEIDSQCIKILDQFVYDPSTVETIKEIKKVYKDFESYKNQIIEGFKHVCYYYPRKSSFTVFLYHSGFNYGVFPVDNEIGIGLDMYLGKDNRITRMLPQEQFPQYMKNNMEPANLVTDVFRGYAIINLIPENKDDDLLGALVYEGKVLYALDAIMPDAPDEVKIRYTKDQLKWCETYAKEIWKDIIDNDWLYTTNVKVITQFTNEAPFTGILPHQSPPRAGSWLGWQMVKAYAAENPGLTLQQILEEDDAKKILRSYKPPK